MKWRFSKETSNSPRVATRTWQPQGVATAVVLAVSIAPNIAQALVGRGALIVALEPLAEACDRETARLAAEARRLRESYPRLPLMVLAAPAVLRRFTTQYPALWDAATSSTEKTQVLAEMERLIDHHEERNRATGAAPSKH